MKLLLILLLLPLSYLVSTAPEAVKTSADYTYELTINSSDADSALFDLFVSGYTLIENGGRTPFQLKKQHLKTPYKITLKQGKYTAIIDSKSKDTIVISKVQGFKNGERMGFCSGESKRTTLEFGPGGTYSVIEK